MRTKHQQTQRLDSACDVNRGIAGGTSRQCLLYGCPASSSRISAVHLNHSRTRSERQLRRLGLQKNLVQPLTDEDHPPNRIIRLHGEFALCSKSRSDVLKKLFFNKRAQLGFAREHLVEAGKERIALKL